LKKAAEAGYPSMCKQALPQWVDKVGGGFKRFGQLLAGGDKARLAPHASRMASMQANGKTGLMDRMRMYWRGLTGKYVNAKEKAVAGLTEQLGKPDTADIARAYLPSWQSSLAADRGATSELRKVLGARLGAGAAALGAGSLMFGGGDDQKAAEAASPEEQVFTAGFCKAAEAMGVDPGALCKQALSLGRVGSWIARGAQRVSGSRAGQAVANGGRRFGQLLAGGKQPVRGAFQLGKGDLNSMANMRGWLGTYWQGLRGGMGPEAAAELRKALAARVGTGAAALGAGSMMLGGGDEQA
jgi:hypothetical protein